jgi:hypothetical protein
MDEPVWFGHIVDKVAKSAGRGCQYGLAELADKVAPKIALLPRYFPDIKIGDIEPVTARTPGGAPSTEDILTFEGRSGARPASHRRSCMSTWPGQPLLETLATRVRASGARFGVVCDADVTAGGNEAWVDQALQLPR